MTLSRFPVALLAVLATIAPAACKDDDSAGPDEDRMTQDEANAFVQGLYGGNLLALDVDTDDVSQLPPGASLPVNTTISCTGGGQARFTGQVASSMNEAQARLMITVSGTLAAASCAFTGDNVSFVFDSDPGLTQEITATLALETFAVSFNVTSSGSFNWRNGTRMGSCSLDNTLAASVSPDDAGVPATAMVSGSVCGLTVNRTINLESTSSS